MPYAVITAIIMKGLSRKIETKPSMNEMIRLSKTTYTIKHVSRCLDIVPFMSRPFIDRKSNLETSGIAKSYIKFIRPGFIHRNGDSSLLWF